MKIQKLAVLMVFIILLMPIGTQAFAVKPPVAVTIDPKTIPKYVNQLTGPPPVYVPEHVDTVTGTEYYTVDMTAFAQQILPTVDALGNPTGFGATNVWGYGGDAKDAVLGTLLGYIHNSPAPSFVTTRGTDIYVRWQNKLTGSYMFAVDYSLHWADPTGTLNMNTGPFPAYPPGNPTAQTIIPVVPHLHGGETQSTSDGGPDQWFTSSGLQGTGYYTELATWWDGTPIQSSEAVYHYFNQQPPATTWYHDHALGLTRINVLSGLAGFYLQTDPADTVATSLPSGKYEVPLAIQDRTFKLNGDFWFPEVGVNPTIHPYWMPEFFGDTIMVDGLVWPNMNVEQTAYRFRLLDGSNARFYTLSFSNKMPFTQIGSDGGYLPTPVPMTQLTIAPGERADLIVDFSKLPVGTKVILTNTAKTPFPNGARADPQTTGQIMQFTVTGTGPTVTPLPTVLNTLPVLTPDAPRRIMTLNEVMGPAGPQEVLLNGLKWMSAVTETPQVGSTEEWVIVNLTADTHPIHLHLVQFQVVSRQPLQATKYAKDWMALNAAGTMTPGMLPFMMDYTPLPLDPAPYLQNKPVGPAPNELGWKDTVQMNPGEVTVIRARWAPISTPTGGSTPGTNLYPFEVTVGPGYVWHCHIIDHEDNEMMRPYTVLP